MATSDVFAQTSTPERFYSKTIEAHKVKASSKETQEELKQSLARYLAANQASSPVGKLFLPSEHLAYEEPERIYTMEDIGYPADQGISPVAVSEPFRLFTEKAIDEMRKEVFNPEVQEKYSVDSNISGKQVRGYAPEHGKYIYEAWNHPEVLALISKIAGVDLVPALDYDIGHVNFSVPGTKNFGDKDMDDDAIVGWHRDSYPFVCVVMMSDTTNMIGGETALRTGTGEIKKVRGPSKGSAIVMQGRYIAHQAMKAFHGQERITMVTSFRPRSPYIRDDTVLTTIRPVSNIPALYGQYMEYQLENAEARIRSMLKAIRASKKAGSIDVEAIKSFLDFEVKALTRVNDEIVDESMIEKGVVPKAQ